MNDLDVLIAQAKQDISEATKRLHLLEGIKARETKSEFVSVEDASKIIGISPQSVRLWVKQNKLKVCRPGRKVLVYRTSIDSIMEKQLGGITENNICT